MISYFSNGLVTDARLVTRGVTCRKGPDPMLESLFGPRNPTLSWPASLHHEITFDLDNASINSVKLGQPLDRLSFLGPDVDRKSFRSGELLYLSRGLAIQFDPQSHSIRGFRIIQSDPHDDRFRPFSGVVLLKGQPVNLESLSPARILDEYGGFYWRDRDEDESILFYEFVGLEWQLEFDTESRLRCITVTNDPILGEVEQRIAYGVTEPWPFPSQKRT